MKILNKKAIEKEELLQNSIFAVIIIVILVLIFSNILKEVSPVSEQSKCESYVKLASAIKTPFTKQSRVDLSNVCKTQKVKIIAKGSSDEDIKNNALDQILQQMYLCGKTWGFSYGEFQRNPFSQWKVDNVCVRCAILTFDEKTQSLHVLDGILMRAMDEKKGIVPDGKGKTYYEFFTGEPPSDTTRQQIASLETGGEKTLDPKEEYFIIYSMNMRATAKDFWTKVGLGTAFGGATGVGTAITVAPWVLPLKAGLKLIGARSPGLGLIVIGFTAAGVASGAYVGANVNEEEYMGEKGAVIILHAKLQEIEKSCKTLGTNPEEDPWGVELAK